MKRTVLMGLSLTAVSIGAIAAVNFFGGQSATAQAQQPQVQEQPQAQPKVGCVKSGQPTGQTI